MSRKAERIPRIRQAGLFPLPGYELYQLNNGLKVYYVRDNSLNTCRIEWVFAAGRAYETTASQSELTAAMLRESNRRYSAYRNAEFFDQYGSSMYIYNGLDHVVAGFACLHKWARLLFDRALLSLREPAWKPADLRLVRKLKMENLQESIADNDIISYRSLTEQIFGRRHPYGYNTTANTLNDISPEALVDHWEQNYFNRSQVLVIAGNVAASDLQYMLGELGSRQLPPAVKPKNRIMVNSKPLPDVPIPGKNQKSIKMGRKMIRRDHPHFTAVYMLSMLLGGYFNSRLNKSIREKKGLTYHISTQLDSARLGGLFYITSDTSTQHVDKVLRSIESELQKICAQPPSKTELNLLKSYVLGNMLNYYEGVYATADTLRLSLTEGVAYEDNARLMQEIRDIEPGELNQKACLYFDPSEMTTVIAG